MDKVNLKTLMITLFMVWCPCMCSYQSGWNYGGYDYWEEEEEEYDVCSFSETPGYAIYGQNDVTMIDTTVEECKKTCVGASRFSCQSLDFNTNTKSCFISSYTKDSPFYGPHANAVHYELECDTVVLLNGESGTPLQEGEYYRNKVDHDETVSYPGKQVYKDGHCFSQYGPIGDEHLITYNPTPMKSDLLHVVHGNISSMTIACSGPMARLQFRYGSTLGEPYFERNHASTDYAINLEPDEFITSISGEIMRVFSQLNFITNKRTLGPFCPYDQGSGKRKFLANGNGKALAYISGQASPIYGPGYLNFFFHC